jgi:mono/diheme cytochrome c family protein
MTSTGHDPSKPSAANGDEASVVRLHEQILREMAEPHDGNEPTPLWLVFGAMLLLGWGGWYLGTYGAAFRADVYDERPGAGAVAAAATPAVVDSLVLGKRAYANCQACHQADGQGIPGTYPPLAGSEWALGSAETLVRIVLSGLQGQLVVKGVSYNQLMPGWSRLSDEQIAAVLTYIRNSWGNSAPAVPPELVRAVRAAEGGRPQPLTAAELVAERPPLDAAATAVPIHAR